MRPLYLAESILSQPDVTMVCYCAKVTKGQIRSAVADGCRTINALRTTTGCCPKENNCTLNHPQHRCCMSDISTLLTHFLTAKQSIPDKADFN